MSRNVHLQWHRWVAPYEARGAVLRHMWFTVQRSGVVADGAMLSRFVHKLEARLTETGRARRTGQEIAGIPIIARNSSVVFVTGNGSLGTLRPSRSQMGSQPSAGDHSSR